MQCTLKGRRGQLHNCSGCLLPHDHPVGLFNPSISTQILLSLTVSRVVSHEHGTLRRFEPFEVIMTYQIFWGLLVIPVGETAFRVQLPDLLPFFPPG